MDGDLAETDFPTCTQIFQLLFPVSESTRSLVECLTLYQMSHWNFFSKDDKDSFEDNLVESISWRKEQLAKTASFLKYKETRLQLLRDKSKSITVLNTDEVASHVTTTIVQI